VYRVVQLNSFGAPRSSLQTFIDIISQSEGKGKTADKESGTCGIWLIASRINHSHDTNCRRSFIGDMQIVRATRDMEAGTELLFPYQSLSASYEKTQQNLNNWGFVCNCALCIAMQHFPKKVMQRRAFLRKDLEATFQSPTGVDMARFERLLLQLSATYSGSVKSELRPDLLDPMLFVSKYKMDEGRIMEGLQWAIKSLRTAGYVLKAVPPENTSSSSKLEVEVWGLVNDWVPGAFLILYRAYMMVAPELCAQAKEYIAITYSMCVGESETMVETMKL
jgi:hypothetical protein